MFFLFFLGKVLGPVDSAILGSETNSESGKQKYSFWF